MADLNRLRDEIAQAAEEEIARISKMESDLRESLDTLAGVVRLYCSEDNRAIFAEHAETVRAVRLLHDAGICVTEKDAASEDGHDGWLEAVWQAAE